MRLLLRVCALVVAFIAEVAAEDECKYTIRLIEVNISKHSILHIDFCLLLIVNCDNMIPVDVSALNPFGHWAESRAKLTQETNKVVVRAQPFVDDGMILNFKFFCKFEEEMYFMVFDKVGDDFKIVYQNNMEANKKSMTTVSTNSH